jgi:hypothetical protein
MAAVRSAKNALRELIRICRNAENTIPLALTDAPRRDGPSWAESLQQLEGALATIDAAPALTFLRRFESQTGVSGDPIKRRNGRLRRELKANGLTREQATTVLVSLLFLQRRTRTRRGRR